MVSKAHLQRHRGFTLIEIAIVLVVIGLLLSGGLLAVGPVIQRAQITETQDKLDRIEDAIVLYVLQSDNQCLPCPGDGALATGSGNDGLSEDDGTPTFYGNGCSPNGGCRAAGGDNVVPWRTLGVWPEKNRLFS